MRRRSRRLHRIVIQRETVTGTNDFGEDVTALTTWTTERAAIFYGTGQEQRQAAQESASQTASFEVLSNAKTRAISVTDKLRYPVADPNPDNWPVWDIQSANELGLNEGVHITATRVAT